METKKMTLEFEERRGNYSVTLISAVGVTETASWGGAEAPDGWPEKQLQEGQEAVLRLRETLKTLPSEGFFWPGLGSIRHMTYPIGDWTCTFMPDKENFWHVCTGSGQPPVKTLYQRLDQLRRQWESGVFCTPCEQYRGLSPREKATG